MCVGAGQVAPVVREGFCTVELKGRTGLCFLAAGCINGPICDEEEPRRVSTTERGAGTLEGA